MDAFLRPQVAASCPVSALTPPLAPPAGLVRESLPKHVAIIMDGNGRWAKQKGSARIFGHRNAIAAVRDTLEGAAELGLGYLTLFAFSTENWKRPPVEVDALMQLLVDTLGRETKTLIKNNIRLRTIGATEKLPASCQAGLRDSIEKTSGCTGLTLTLALSYGARADIVNAMRRIAAAVQLGELHAENITDDTVRSYLTTAGIPDPELLIRTSGELRVSNFLLWEIAYAEIYISPTLWPDFRRQDLWAALLNYQQRERRFGLTSEQLRYSS